MGEDLLHFIWKYRKFTTRNLMTSDGQSVEVLNPGNHNMHSGPDFLNARIAIDGQLWAGNVEIHLRTTDWYHHKHHIDMAYDNIILHIVWVEDGQLRRMNGELIPALLLRNYVDEKLLGRYNALFRTKKNQFILCQEQFPWSSVGLQSDWIQQLYRQRLDNKAQRLLKLLESCKMDWEKLLFISLLKSFGQRVNANSFLSLARALNFLMVRRIGRDTYQLECILMGLSGILRKYCCDDVYGVKMYTEYRYLKRKHNFIEEQIELPEFMGVRPSNFPTIRLSQFAVLYSGQSGLFAKLMSFELKEDIYDLFDVGTTEYWKSHYVFGKPSRKKIKRLSKAFINNIIINTVIPIKYLYNKEHGKDIFHKLSLMLISISREDNVLVNKYRKLDINVRHALDSQALIQLYDHYCIKKRCLQCAIGNQILN